MTLSNCETAFRFLIVYTPSRAELKRLILTKRLQAKAYTQTNQLHRHNGKQPRKLRGKTDAKKGRNLHMLSSRVMIRGEN